MPKNSSRGQALKILNNITADKAYTNIAIDVAFKNSNFDARDRAFISAIVYGTIQNLKLIDYQIEKSSNIKLKKITPSILNILRLSVCQICCMDKVPNSAAVNEGVKLAKKVTYSSSGYVNAVLRNIIRKGLVLPQKDNVTEYLSVLYSYPEWMVKMWLLEFGREECEKLLKAGNETPRLTIRVNRLKISREELKEKLNAEYGIAEDALDINESGKITELYGFPSGCCTNI